MLYLYNVFFTIAGLVDCYLSSHRTREAITFATQACKQLGQNARSLTLYASVLAQEPLSLEKVV